jgi:hypothetical protein
LREDEASSYSFIEDMIFFLIIKKIGGARAGETLEGKAGEFRANLSPTPAGGIDLGFSLNLVLFFFARQHLLEALIFFSTADILLLSLSAVETGVQLHVNYIIYIQISPFRQRTNC